MVHRDTNALLRKLLIYKLSIVSLLLVMFSMVFLPHRIKGVLIAPKVKIDKVVNERFEIDIPDFNTRDLSFDNW